MSPEETVEFASRVEAELVRFIVEHCSRAGQVESRFLYPDPAHYVFTFPLFDALSEKTGVTKEQIAAWFEAAQEERERRDAIQRAKR